MDFHEILFDPLLVATETGEKFPIVGSPEFANAHLFNATTGVYKTAVRRYDSIRKITLTIALADAQKSAYFDNFWDGGWGSAFGFRFRYVPNYVSTLEAFGTGDGVTTVFPLIKSSTRPGAPDSNPRRVVKPVVNTNLKDLGLDDGSASLYEPNGSTARVITYPFKIYKNVGAGDVEQTTGWTVNNRTGRVYFTVAPALGATLKWSGEEDLPVAFVGNSYSHNFDVPSTIHGVELRQILPAELEIYD